MVYYLSRILSFGYHILKLTLSFNGVGCIIYALPTDEQLHRLADSYGWCIDQDFLFLNYKEQETEIKEKNEKFFVNCSC
jgi:hypothetical protein